LPLLAYGSVELGIEREWAPMRVRLGYRLQSLYGPAFTELMLGPFITLGAR
jgi:hypothetical protein